MKHFKEFSTVASLVKVALIVLTGLSLVSAMVAQDVTLEWNASPDPVQRYTVHYGTASRAYTQTANAGTALTHTVTGLSPGQTYFFAVTAIGTNSLESDFSNEVSYSVPNPNNTAPTISSIASQTINEDGTAGPVSFTVGDGETPAGSLTLTGTSSNTGLVPPTNIVFGGSGANRSVTVTPAADQSGSAQITMTVSDGLLTASRTFTLTVNSVNDAPTLSALPNQTTSIGNAVGPISVTVGDVETSASSLTLTGNSSNTGLVPNANIVFGGSGANRTLTVTPVANQTGTAQINVTVSDGSLTASRTFTMTVVTAQTLGLVAAYGFDEGSGNSVADASGNGNTGTVNGSSWTGSGRFGGAMSFGGAGRVSVNNSASLQLTDALTLEAWVYPTAAVGNWATVLMKERSGSMDYCLYAESQSGSPEAYVYLNGGERVAAAPGPLPLNQWAHLAATYDGTTFRLFVDGQQVDARNQSGAIPAETGPLSMGGNTVWNEYFTGRIDEVRIYNRALSVAEIQADMNTPIGAPPANTAPTISTIANQTINEDGATGAVPFTVGDAETAAGSLTVTRISSNSGLIPTANVVLGGSGANRTVTVTPAADQSGTAQITVTASDGSLTASSTFTVTVNSVNDQPTLATLSDVSAAQGAGTQTVNISGIGTGAANESQTLTVSAVSSSPAVVPNPPVLYTSPNSTGALQFTPLAVGSAVITVTVQDNGGTANGGVNDVQRSFTVNVTSPANTPPTITGIASQTINEDGLSGPLGFTVNDAQTPPGNLTVTGASSNTGLVPNANIVFGGSGGTRTVTVRPATNQVGTTQITLTVGDGTFSATTSFTLTVNEVNDRPTLASPAPVSITPVPQAQGLGLAALGAGATVWDVGSGYLVPEQAVALTGISTGGENSQTLTVTAVSSNPSLVPNPIVTYTSPASTASLRFTPSSTPGAAQITVTVRDNGGTANGGADTVTATFAVTINAQANTPPTLAAIADRTMNEDASSAPVSLSINDAQTSAGALTVTTVSRNTSVIANSGLQLGGSGASRTLTVQPVVNQYGKSLVTVQVTDAQGASASRAFWINVLPVNDAPLLDAISAVLLDGQSPLEFVTLTGLSPGPFEATQTVSVQASSSNPGLIPHPEVAYRSGDASAELQLLPVAGVSGTATITVTVRDDGGVASGGVDTFTRTFTVTSTAPLAAAALPQQVMEAAASAILSLPLPRLAISVERDTVIVSWDAAAGPAVLERSATFGEQTSWTVVGAPVEQIGDRNVVHVGLREGAEFFRLTRL